MEIRWRDFVVEGDLRDHGLDPVLMNQFQAVVLAMSRSVDFEAKRKWTKLDLSVVPGKDLQYVKDGTWGLQEIRVGSARLPRPTDPERVLALFSLSADILKALMVELGAGGADLILDRLGPTE